MSSKKKIALLVDSTVVSKQLYDLCVMAQRSGTYEITHLIVQGTSPSLSGRLRKARDFVTRHGTRKFLSSVSFRALSRVEGSYLRRNPRLRNCFERRDLSEFGFEILHVAPQISPNGLVHRYTKQDLDKIAALDLQMLVRGGTGIIKGRILNLLPHGIIAFHHADNQVNRGGPPGFWEVYRKERRTGFFIQRLSEEVDGGTVLYEGFIPTAPNYTINRARIYEKSTVFLHRTIEHLLAGEAPPMSVPKRPYAYPLYVTPDIGQQLRYAASSAASLLRRRSHKLLGLRNRWGVAYQFADDWRDVSLWRSKKIKNPPNRFLADPFVWKKDGVHYCFVEDYDYLIGRGRISVFKITQEGYEEVGPAIEEEFHLSYPFLLEHEGRLYMCPETHEAQEIRLYECTHFPCEWKLAKTLMRQVAAVDTSIVRRGDRWWMLTNICSSDLGEFGSELHIYSSKDLLSDNWTPHPKNPVIFDSLCGRNGGMIQENDNLFRVFQTQGFDAYGEACGVAQIDALSEDGYQEHVLFDVRPEFFEGMQGVHTYNHQDGLLVLDYVQRRRTRS